MPQQINKFGLVKKIVGSKQPTEQEKIAYEKYAQEFNRKKKETSPVFNAGENLINSLANFGKGLIGFDDAPSGESISGSNALGQVLTAGLPFHAITKGKPVFHGTGKVFQRFDPRRYDKADTLGSFTHFAENPEYAAKYATSDMKIERGNNPNIIPAYIDSKNTLDLTEPNSITGEDVSAILAALEDSYTKSIIKRTYQAKLRNPEDVNINPNKTIEHFLSAEPKVLEKTPFDAIRYRDSDNDKSIAWAVPDRTTITTPWGTDISPIRNNELSGIVKHLMKEFGLFEKDAIEVSKKVKSSGMSINDILKNMGYFR